MQEGCVVEVGSIVGYVAFQILRVKAGGNGWVLSLRAFTRLYAG